MGCTQPGGDLCAMCTLWIDATRGAYGGKRLARNATRTLSVSSLDHLVCPRVLRDLVRHDQNQARGRELCDAIHRRHQLYAAVDWQEWNGWDAIEQYLAAHVLLELLQPAVALDVRLDTARLEPFRALPLEGDHVALEAAQLEQLVVQYSQPTKLDYVLGEVGDREGGPGLCGSFRILTLLA